MHGHFQIVHSTAAGPLPTALYTKEREAHGRQFNFSLFLLSSRHVDCARKSRQLMNLTVLIKSLALLQIEAKGRFSLLITKMIVLCQLSTHPRDVMFLSLQINMIITHANKLLSKF